MLLRISDMEYLHVNHVLVKVLLNMFAFGGIAKNEDINNSKILRLLSHLQTCNCSTYYLAYLSPKNKYISSHPHE